MLAPRVKFKRVPLVETVTVEIARPIYSIYRAIMFNTVKY